MVSVVIPSRNERYLGNTCQEVMEKAQEDVEVMFILDDGSLGMRDAIKTMIENATGKYVMKLDAHCALDEGFDVKLKKHHRPNWVQIPQRRQLDAPTWTVDPDYRVSDMIFARDFIGVRRGTVRKEKLHPTQVFQGSCYFMEKDYFTKLGFFDEGFGPFAHEAAEITIRVKADGGEIIRNQHTWYAHAKLGRMYVADRANSDEYVKEYARKWGYEA